MKKQFTNQYINDCTKKAITATVSGSDKASAALSIAVQLGCAPIILKIEVLKPLNS